MADNNSNFLKMFIKHFPADKQFFYANKIGLSTIGFYPETKLTIRIRLWAAFNWFVFFSSCTGLLFYGLHYITIDVAAALDALCPLASTGLGFVKVSYVWWYRDDFKNLIVKMRKLAESRPKTTVNNETRNYYYSVSTLFILGVFACGLTTATVYALRPILMNLVRFRNGDEIIYDTPFKIIFPAVFLRMPLYPLTYLMLYWFGLICVFGVFAVDGIILSSGTYIGTIMMSLQEELKEIVAERPVGYILNRNDELKICKQLANVVALQNELHLLTEEMSSLLASMAFAQFISSGIILATCIVGVLLFSGIGIVIYISYSLCVIGQIFLYCISGTIIMETSSQLATVAYCTCWYEYSVPVQKMILLLMIRAQRSFVVNMPFFSPSLAALTTIFRFTGSWIAMANQLINRP